MLLFLLRPRAVTGRGDALGPRVSKQRGILRQAVFVLLVQTSRHSSQQRGGNGHPRAAGYEGRLRNAVRNEPPR